MREWGGLEGEGEGRGFWRVSGLVSEGGWRF